MTRDRNAGFATGQARVWGFDARTGIDSRSYFAPGSKLFYVDPNNAQATDAGNLGEDPTVPLATVAAAVALVRPYLGDTIIVGANDAWQYAADLRDTAIQESLVIPATVGGFRIVGASSNPLGVTWEAAAADEFCITVYGMDVLIEGFVFTGVSNGIQAVWDGSTMYGENLTVRGCHFDDGLNYGIQLDYSWYTHIHDNQFHNVSVAAIHNLDVEGDPDYLNIHDNLFVDNTAAIDLEDVNNCFIYRNLINGTAAGVNNMIDLTGGSGNLVTGNVLSCTIAQYDTACSDATSGAWIANDCTDGQPVAPPV